MTTSATTGPLLSTFDRTKFIESVGEIIAASRYKRWDSHAPKVPWAEYVDQDPAVAEGIYLSDGRADAEALMPFLNLVYDKARSSSYARAADITGEHDTVLAAVDALLTISAAFDPITNGAFDAAYPEED